MDLRITEIFYSLQGETRTVGLPTVFIRLTGCPLRCGYCDTAYAFHGGKSRSIDYILLETERYKPKYVTVTGGEPLAQPACHDLLEKLCDRQYEVSLETSGAMDIAAVDPRTVIVMDIKTPGSKEVAKNRYSNIDHLKQTDQIKFVICDRADYEWAKELLITKSLSHRCEILFSPAYEQLDYHHLADWIIEDNLPVRFQIQLHKIVWGNTPGK